MRQIDADALIESICWDECERKHEDCDYMCSSIAPIVNAPTVGGWISVKDRMPEENGQYLVLLNQTHLMLVSFAKKLEEVEREVFAGRDEPGWFEWDTEWCGFYEITGVTHWMQMPEPPEEVTGERR